MNKWRSSGRREKVVFPKRLIVWRKRSSRGRDGPSVPVVMNGMLVDGWVEGVLDSRCPPSCPRKGCDVSCVNLTLIRRVINARVNIRHIYIYRCKIHAIYLYKDVQYYILLLLNGRNTHRTRLRVLVPKFCSILTTVVPVYTT